jgi:hypothetical protein
MLIFPKEIHCFSANYSKTFILGIFTLIITIILYTASQKNATIIFPQGAGSFFYAGTPFIQIVQLTNVPPGRLSVINRPVPGRNPACESG